MSEFKPVGSQEAFDPAALGERRKAAKQRAAKALRRRKSLMQRAHAAHQDCDYEVLLVLDKKPRRWVYTTSKQFESLILSRLMESYPLPVIEMPETMDEREVAKAAEEQLLREAAGKL